jgi:hypothetical protein
MAVIVADPDVGFRLGGSNRDVVVRDATLDHDIFSARVLGHRMRLWSL